MLRGILTGVVGIFLFSAQAQDKKGFQFLERPANKQVDVVYNNQLLTAYCFYDSSRKPVLFPVNTVEGITVTRSYPFRMVAGERTDHPHHTGIWFNYESVNGLDFWNNSTAIPVEKRHLYGTIRHKEIVRKKADENRAEMVTASTWERPDGKVLLNENTTFQFRVEDNTFFIDRITTLKATDTVVHFKDIKDGLVAIRVARELEMPSKDATRFVDNKGNVTTVAATDNNGVTGMYHASNGQTGDAVWSSKGPWVMLSGKKEGKEITIAIIDHPSNMGYPTYWHARGYGLFAANPLGRKIFSNGKEELNFSLQPGASVRFRYRFVIQSGQALTTDNMNRQAAAFAREK
ncbi:PmoA family protein [Flavisolibacter sp. BT320]|nr:PmoA family protein [Flavisolibacter longurius]